MAAVEEGGGDGHRFSPPLHVKNSETVSDMGLKGVFSGERTWWAAMAWGCSLGAESHDRHIPIVGTSLLWVRGQEPDV